MHVRLSRFPRLRLRILGALGAMILLATGQATHGSMFVAEYAKGGCTMRDGPGDFAQNCITIYYTGARVNKIEGGIQAAKAPAFPATVCNATFEMWGQLASGRTYRVSHPASECSAFHLGVTASDVNEVFQSGTTICSRSLWENKWSNPACVPAPDSSSWSGPLWSPHGN